MLRTWLRAALVVVGAAMAIGPARAGAEDLAELSANEAAARIRAGTLKSEDLVNALVEVIERKRDLNAFISFDRDRVLAAARKADSLAARKSFAGPLHGVPVVLKDNIHVAGRPNTAGTPGLQSFVPTRNAPVAEKLIRAGAIVLGKTNMHVLAFGITSNNAAFGPARNAYDATRIAGGSSGGTANAIAARLKPRAPSVVVARFALSVEREASAERTQTAYNAMTATMTTALSFANTPTMVMSAKPTSHAT